LKSPAALSLGLLLAATSVRSAAAPPLQARDGSAKPAVWMMPPPYDNGRCFRDLFEQPDAWQEARSVIDVLGYADLNVNKQFTDDQLRAWFPKGCKLYFASPMRWSGRIVGRWPERAVPSRRWSAASSH
jgi:hypothetical protein